MDLPEASSFLIEYFHMQQHELKTTRVARVREEFVVLGIDALLVTNAADVVYICGFCGVGDHREVEVLITSSRVYVIVDGRNTTQAREVCVGFDIETCLPAGRNATIAAVLLRDSIAVLGIDEHACAVADERGLGKLLMEQSSSATIVKPVSSVITHALRAVKSDGEIASLRRACAIADAAYAWIIQTIRPGFTEREFAWMLEKVLRELGAEKLAFESIVASGPNSANPHHHNGQRVLSRGDAVVCDFGAVVDGYHSDMTRTVFLSEVSEQQRNVYSVVQEAQARAAAPLHSGMHGAQMHAIARSYIEQAGYGEFFTHGLGHGIGLAVHEYPVLNAYYDKPLPVGAAVTIEPGVYIPGAFGVRIEDDYLVLDSGCERLTHAPSELVVCG